MAALGRAGVAAVWGPIPHQIGTGLEQCMFNEHCLLLVLLFETRVRNSILRCGRRDWYNWKAIPMANMQPGACSW